MIRKTVLGFVLVVATAASAEEFPALYAVTGVASDDRLNLRAAPSGTADILTSLPPDAREIEVVARNGNWLRLNWQDSSGWAAARYLQSQGDMDWAAMRQPLRCFGTEPFWSVDLTPRARAVFSDFGNEVGVTPLYEDFRREQALDDPRPARAMVHRLDDGRTLFSDVRAGLCSDGMSDLTYGLTVTMMLGKGDDVRVLHGCCSVAP